MHQVLDALPGFATTPGGALAPLAILLPVAGLLASFMLGGRRAEALALALGPVNLVVALLIAFEVARAGAPVVYVVGGYAPPLGIALRADGFSATMLVASAIVVTAACFFARANFATPEGMPESRAPFAFWILVQALSGALAIVFLGGDLFNLYVALELLTFAAVPLVCLDGRASTLSAALRYLVFALFGSVLYLLGAALLYGAYGTLDILLLGARVRPEPAVYAAAGLMTAGLLAKTALFPLHLWLPPAHANAPAAGSAVLSALVVKGSFFLLVRLWFSVFPGLPDARLAGALLAGLGCLAVLFGSVLALRQQRLKLLIAYSTVAQIGYLFLMFPLAMTGAPWSLEAWGGGIMQTLAHAFAKAGMFMAAGLVAESLGHDRILDLGGVGRAMPMTALALGVGGLSLMGLPPSGGFLAKWLLLSAASEAGAWTIVAVILAGGLLACGYVYRIVAPALEEAAAPLKTPPRRGREAIALGLTLIAVLIGFAPAGFFDFLDIGRIAAP